MQEIITIDYKAQMIVHFRQDENPLRRTVAYQVLWNPDNLSPSGDFIRFSSIGEEISEIHGWVRVEDIVVDEILERIEEEAKVEPEEMTGVTDLMRGEKVA